MNSRDESCRQSKETKETERLNHSEETERLNELGWQLPFCEIRFLTSLKIDCEENTLDDYLSAKTIRKKRSLSAQETVDFKTSIEIWSFLGMQAMLEEDWEEEQGTGVKKGWWDKSVWMMQEITHTKLFSLSNDLTPTASVNIDHDHFSKPSLICFLQLDWKFGFSFPFQLPELITQCSTFWRPHLGRVIPSTFWVDWREKRKFIPRVFLLHFSSLVLVHREATTQVLTWVRHL